jgi:hypothetical protein
VLDVSPGVTWALNDTLQLHGSIGAAARYRKQLSLSENAFVGVRYMFD